MFLMKKIISGIFMPVSFIIELLVAGLILLWFTKRQAAARLLITVASFLLLATGFGIVTDDILYRLENMYPPLDIQVPLKEKVSWVVVLAGGHASDSRLPVTSQLNEYTQVRLNEGIRITAAVRLEAALSGGIYTTLCPCGAQGESPGLGVDRPTMCWTTRRGHRGRVELIRPMSGRNVSYW
jgi:hypothetical protein